MSLMIKGMDMPESCLKCPFTFEGDCTANEGLTDVYLLELTLTERHPKCTLKEIPTPHGRLIDADSLIEYINKELKGDEYIQRMFRRIVKSRPTVIEAEE